MLASSKVLLLAREEMGGRVRERGHKRLVHQARHDSDLMCIPLGFWLSLGEGEVNTFFFYVVQGCLGKVHSMNTCHLAVPKVYEDTANPRGWSVCGTWL